MNKDKIYKVEIVNKGIKEVEKMVIWPFQTGDRDKQTAFGFILAMSSLLLVGITISNPLVLMLGTLKLSYSLIGLMGFFVGLWYLIEVTFK